jgi:hypothetical protein
MIENINKAPLQKNKNMTHYHLIIENYLQNSVLNSETLSQELINQKAIQALEELESIRLSGVDVNTAQEIVIAHLIENLNPIIAP